ncbi:hypothetical protein FACS1894105_03450 [Clostridia bacterium]|nr:hypothetical protein FACS1894105_03450 [Clostridia bacterium]
MRWNISLITKVREIQEKPNLEFLMEFLLADLDRKRRNFYLISTKFDVVKTFENYIYDDNYLHDIILINKIK